MARRKQLRELLGIFKDKASFIKTILSIKRSSSSSIRLAVLRATTHASSSPPPDHRITALLSLGQGSRLTASRCVESIMDRLHNTRSVHVALKCLITLHVFITRGSFILKDQLSFYPSGGGRNFLNLSRFFDKNDVVTWELSSWARWYASVLERNLITSRVLGSYFSSSSFIKKQIEKDKENLRVLLNSDLLRETETLVLMVEEICKAPETLNYQRNNLVYEVMKLVSEDYRLTQYYTMNRLSELGDRITELSHDESAELTSCLKRLEDCKERLFGMFLNRKRNYDFWDLVTETKVKLVKVKEERERVLVRVGRKDVGSESTGFEKRVVGPTQLMRLLPYGGNWLGVDGFHLTVGTAMT